LKEAAAFGEEFGVTMALQNHAPLIRHWKDCYDLVQEVGSPWLKVCLDLPLLTSFEEDFIRQAVLTVGGLQVYSHYGGEFYRDQQGHVRQKMLDFGKPNPDYAYFISLLREIGYDGYFGYELCHPVLDDNHQPLGLNYVDEQVKLAHTFMSELIK
jgi:sugar phosphate isomerase/epimerase